MSFQYDITSIPAETFQHLAIFCSEEGDCSLGDVPMDQITLLREILNEKGAFGWELVQLFFHESGVVAFWKRPKNFVPVS